MPLESESTGHGRAGVPTKSFRPKRGIQRGRVVVPAAAGVAGIAQRRRVSNGISRKPDQAHQMEGAGAQCVHRAWQFESSAQQRVLSTDSNAPAEANSL